MEANQKLQELAIYLFNRTGEIQMGEDIRPKIYEVLAYGKQIPAEGYKLIPDKRYHKQFDIVYGFMWYLRKVKEPPFEVYYSIITGMAFRISLPFISQGLYARLLLYTLLVEYFEQQE